MCCYDTRVVVHPAVHNGAQSVAGPMALNAAGLKVACMHIAVGTYVVVGAETEQASHGMLSQITR